jgi:hypothetical protein
MTFNPRPNNPWPKEPYEVEHNLASPARVKPFKILNGVGRGGKYSGIFQSNNFVHGPQPQSTFTANRTNKIEP